MLPRINFASFQQSSLFFKSHHPLALRFICPADEWRATIEAAAERDATEGAPQHPAAARSTSWSSNDRPVAHGQERLATTSERDEMEAMLYEHDAVQKKK
jgi:hypothetical protein